MESFGQCTHVAMDGTFKKTPNSFYQLYTVHGLIDGHFRPMFFALLTKKSSALYERLLLMIREVVPRLDPHSIIIDFEMAMIMTVKKVFPGMGLVKKI